MQKYVNLFEYGNRNIGGGIDQFWLIGEARRGCPGQARA
jgi:beta-lactamase class D